MNQPHPYTILIVDDTPTDLKLLAKILKKEGYRVKATMESREALQIASEEIPDLILLDIILPEMTGYEICQQLKADECTHDIPILFISSLNEIPDKIRAFSLGGVDYITKPFDIKEVLARVENHLTLRSMQKRLQEKNEQLQREINERKRAEETLHQYKKAVEASGDIIAVLDQNYTYLLVNETTLKYHQLERDEILGHTVAEILGETTFKNIIKPQIDRCLVGEQVSYEMSYHYPKLGQRHLLMKYSPLRDDEDEIIGMVNVIRDITERKEAEEALKKSHEKLRRSNERLMVMNGVGQLITSQLQLEDVLNTLARSTAKFLESDASAILLVDEHTNSLSIKAAYGLSQHVVQNTYIRLGESIAGRVALTGQPLIINDLPNSFTFDNPAAKDEGLLAIASVPLIAGNKVIGTLDVHSKTSPHAFGQSQIHFLHTLAGQAAIAIENARLFNEAQHQRQVAKSLSEVATVLNRSLTQDKVLSKIFEQLGRVIQYDSGAVFLREGNKLIISSGANLKDVEIGYQVSLLSEDPVARVFKQQKDLVLADVHKDEHWQIRGEGKNIRSWIGAPLLTEQEIIGVLTVDHFETHAYTQKEAEILRTFTDHAAIAIRNARQVERIEEALYETKLLYQIGNILAKTSDVQAGIEQALREYIRALHLKQGGIWLFKPDEDDLIRQIYYVEPQTQVEPLQIENISQIYQTISQKGKPLVISAAESPNQTPLLLVPLSVRGENIGLVGIDITEKPDPFSEREIKLAQAITDQIATAVENTRLFHEEQRQRQMAENRNKELDAFSRTVAHDLKNPLSVLVSYSDYLVGFAHQMEMTELHKALKTIRESARKGVNIVNELLLLAGVRKQEVPIEAVDMAYTVKQAKKRLNFMVEEYGGTIKMSARWPTSQGYGPWIEEVWVNYISNGLKYGGKPPQLELGATVQTDGMVRFWIQDNGRGLTQEEQSTLFTEFTRLNEVRAKGHGLGLSIVRRIVEKLGGEVGVESAGIPGQGSLFYFTLPEKSSQSSTSPLKKEDKITDYTF